ncbi:MAG: ispE [Micavibrio sp.]|nr:ispE [Micavibrio sp.]
MRSAKRPLSVFAPAKINLYLHVTGRQDNGYHLLDSLAVFADIGDRIAIEAADDFSFQITGPYASAFTAQDRNASQDSGNLAVRAAWALARHAEQDLPFRMTLTKNLPLAAGIGGGSSDAAAVLWGLMNLWNISMTSSPWLPGLMRELGADVPACLRCVPVRMTGIGDILDPVPNLPEIPVVLVNPGKHCPTPEVFRKFIGPMRMASPLPDLSSPQNLIEHMNKQDNDLTPAACEIVPEIGEAISLLSAQQGCALSRMSGSGATVFGLFETMDDAENAVAEIANTRSGWWVRGGTINSPQRY